MCFPGLRSHSRLNQGRTCSQADSYACFLVCCSTRIKVKFFACHWSGAHPSSLPCGHYQHQSQRKRKSDKNVDVITSEAQSPDPFPGLYHIPSDWFSGGSQTPLKEKDSHRSVDIRRQGWLRTIFVCEKYVACLLVTNRHTLHTRHTHTLQLWVALVLNKLDI